MKFGWINLFGAGVVVVMLLPNIVYALRSPGEKNRCENRLANAAEQLGRYACIVLMWLPLLVWEFGFADVAEMVLYLFGNAALLLAYLTVFLRYLKKKTAYRRRALAILPAGIFLLSGLLLRHWLLVGFALLFAAGHIYVTEKNAQKDKTA